MSEGVLFDWQRAERTGVPEVVFGEGKTLSQLSSIARQALEQDKRILMTRVTSEKASELVRQYSSGVFWNELSRTVIVGSAEHAPELSDTALVAIVAAGTSDHALVAEIEQCLEFLGVRCSTFIDVGVAGLWRLTSIAEQLEEHPLLIAVAGMEGALFSVLAGLVSSPVIAVPSSVGYGVSAGGHAALHSALGSCAPGIAVVNIDNGFGAAALALKMLQLHASVVGNGS